MQVAAVAAVEAQAPAVETEVAPQTAPEEEGGAEQPAGREDRRHHSQERALVLGIQYTQAAEDSQAGNPEVRNLAGSAEDMDYRKAVVVVRRGVQEHRKETGADSRRILPTDGEAVAVFCP